MLHFAYPAHVPNQLSKQCGVLLQLLPEVPHGWLIQEVISDIIETAKQSGFEMVCPRANALTADGVQELKAAGFVVRAWGLKTIEVSDRIGCIGVHCVGIKSNAERTPGCLAVCRRVRYITPMCADRLDSLPSDSCVLLLLWLFLLQLLHHVVACGVDGATVNWPKAAGEALADSRDSLSSEALHELH
jgi:hypothetical protein